MDSGWMSDEFTLVHTFLHELKSWMMHNERSWTLSAVSYGFKEENGFWILA